jgi:hypothetical protein
MAGAKEDHADVILHLKYQIVAILLNAKIVISFMWYMIGSTSRTIPTIM